LKVTKDHRSIAGFTLIELLVVVAIISVLAAVAIVQYATYRTHSVDVQMKSELKNAAVAMESYYAEHKSYSTSVSDIVAVGFRQTEGMTLEITLISASSYTLTASKANGSRPSFTYSSATGEIN
jgi:prepilin-type N-terminal cleavage/methylation domain-containing protein